MRKISRKADVGIGVVIAAAFVAAALSMMLIGRDVEVTERNDPPIVSVVVNNPHAHSDQIAAASNEAVHRAVQRAALGESVQLEITVMDQMQRVLSEAVPLRIQQAESGKWTATRDGLPVIEADSMELLAIALADHVADHAQLIAETSR